MKLIAARYIYIYIYNTYIFIYIGRDVIPLCLQNSFAKELFNLLYHEMKFLKKKSDAMQQFTLWSSNFINTDFCSTNKYLVC